MYANKPSGRRVLTLIAMMLLISFVDAQEKKVTPTTQELFRQIAYLDSLLFDAYNNQNLDKFKSFFNEDFEWFRDNGGLVSPKAIFDGIESNFKKEFKLRRTLVKGSLEVHPIRDYGAIEIGSHRFSHVENGKEEIATFKFLMIWQNKDDRWKISKVISYDH